MRIILLGPNGQLGTDIRKRFSELNLGSEAELIPIGRELLDISRLDSIEEVLGPIEYNTLINATSYHKTDEVEDNAQLANAVNAHGVQKVAEMCEAKGARVVHVSTDYVFGGDPSRSEPYKEKDAPSPVNVYGATKLMGEALLATSSSNWLIFRVASLFGAAGASGKGGNFVETMIRLSKERDELRVVNDQCMSPTSTSLVADVILRSVMEKVPTGIYHAVCAGSATWFDFAQAILERTGSSSKVVPISSSEYEMRARRPGYSVLSNEKVCKWYGAVNDWHEYLDQYLEEKGHLA